MFANRQNVLSVIWLFRTGNVLSVVWLLTTDG